jgi:type I restriction-modification system DNA methylase subunit
MATTKENIKELLIKQSLTSQELDILRNYEPNDGQNILYSFFTPVWLCEVMYKLAIKYGFDEKTGKILEPATGTGNFLEVIKHPENVTAFELNQLNYQIAKKRVPNVGIFENDYFETNFLEYPRFKRLAKQPRYKDFDLIIGNPPYGKNVNLYSSYFKKLKFKQTEFFFIYKSMELLRPGGLLIFITASNFMRNGKKYLPEKTKIAEISEFVDAYRMPKVFKHTDVPTDILIFRRK